MEKYEHVNWNWEDNTVNVTKAEMTDFDFWCSENEVIIKYSQTFIEFKVIYTLMMGIKSHDSKR